MQHRYKVSAWRVIAVITPLLLCNVIAATTEAPDPNKIKTLADQAAASTNVMEKVKLVDELLGLDDPAAAMRLVAILRADEFVLSGDKNLRSDFFSSTPASAVKKPLLALFTEASRPPHLPCRGLVAQLLAKTGDPSAAKAIATVLSEEVEHGAAPIAVEYCDALGKLKNDVAVSALANMFGPKTDGEITTASAAALANIGTDAALESLSEQIFSSPNSETAILAFEKVSAERAMPVLINAVANRTYQPPGAERKELMLLKEFNLLGNLVRAKARELRFTQPVPYEFKTTDLIDGQGPRVLDAERMRLRVKLLSWWQTNKPTASTTRAVFVTRSAVSDRVDALMNQINSPKEHSQARAALRNLLSIDDPYAANRLCDWLRNGDASTVNWTLQSDANERSISGASNVFVDPLLRLLADGVALERSNRAAGTEFCLNVAILLREVRDTRATKPVIAALNYELSRKTPIMGLVASYCRALGAIGDAAAVPELQRVLLKVSKSPTIANEETLQASIDSLRQIGTDDSFAAVGKLLVVNQHTHELAMAAFNGTTNPRCIPPLIEALTYQAPRLKGETDYEQRQQQLRGEVFTLLAKKTGQAALGSDVAKWRKWWLDHKAELIPATRPVIP